MAGFESLQGHRNIHRRACGTNRKRIYRLNSKRISHSLSIGHFTFASSRPLTVTSTSSTLRCLAFRSGPSAPANVVGLNLIRVPCAPPGEVFVTTISSSPEPDRSTFTTNGASGNEIMARSTGPDGPGAVITTSTGWIPCAKSSPLIVVGLNGPSSFRSTVGLAMPEVLSTALVMVICLNSPAWGLPGDGLVAAVDGLDDVLAGVVRGVVLALSGFCVHAAWKQMVIVVRTSSDRVT
jgi:hypothetical protein